MKNAWANEPDGQVGMVYDIDASEKQDKIFGIPWFYSSLI